MYLALYRKYRPKTFDDVISQEHITTTLKNQIIGGTTAHAYLFTGSRGTGKTTCAKILAMAVNCLDPKDGNPCFCCANCRDIESGAATDVIEMDAASNNGVDDVRQLRDEVAYTPVSCKYRVYIIDEVHMLSVQAFNALLKTLEEPPEHVKFILATTELHKVLPTIISRCQRFDFRRIDPKQSAQRLLSVAEKEGVTLDEEAAELIARLSDGGMRDALSVLDRCVCADSHITTEIVRSCAGVADSRHLFSFSEMVAQKDVSGCIKLLNELHNASKDIARIIDELSGHYRDLMLYKTVPADTELLTALPFEHGEVARIAELYSLEDILRCLTLLQQCADNIGKTKQRKTLAEMCFVRMCLGLSAQGEGAARPTLHIVNPPASSGLPAGAAVQFVPVEPPKEEFVPTPTEKMSPQNNATLNKLRELNRQTRELVENMPPKKRGSIPAAPAEQFAPPPDLSSTPAAPQEFDAPPPPEEPPAEYIPQREFDTAPPAEQNSPQRDVPAAEAAEVMQNAMENSPVTEETQAEPPVEEVTKADTSTAEAPAEKTAPALSAISDAEWAAAIEKLYPMTKMLFSGSRAVIMDGMLEVHSSNSLLLNAVKDDDRKSLESELSEALGTAVRLKIVPAEKETAQQADASPVKTLLAKAKELNIEVILK